MRWHDDKRVPECGALDAEGLPPAVPVDEIAADMRPRVAKLARDLVGRLEAAAELARDLEAASREWLPPPPVMPEDCDDPETWQILNGYWTKDKVLEQYRYKGEEKDRENAALSLETRMLPCRAEMSALLALVGNIHRDCEQGLERDIRSVLLDCSIASDRRAEAVRRRDAAAAKEAKEP